MQINRRNWARGPLPATPEEVILVASVIGQTLNYKVYMTHFRELNS